MHWDCCSSSRCQLQQDKISLEESDVDVKTAKATLFPSLSFNTGHNVTNRPYQENSSTVNGTEIISSNSKTTYSGNYGLNAQWTVWNGNKRINTIKQKKMSREIAGLTVAQTENSLQEQIAQVFIQILYADESVKINENTLQVSRATYERGVELFNEGSISRPTLHNWKLRLVMTNINWLQPKVRSGVISYNSNNCSNWREPRKWILFSPL